MYSILRLVHVFCIEKTATREIKIINYKYMQSNIPNGAYRLQTAFAKVGRFVFNDKSNKSTEQTT